MIISSDISTDRPSNTEITGNATRMGKDKDTNETGLLQEQEDCS